MRTSKVLSVVTGTYNRIALLMKLVNSVRQSVGVGMPYEIVVVDGGSTDGSIQWCKHQPDIRLIEHGQLLGAIKAFNDGCAHARGKYVVLANDDVEFLNDTLIRAVVYMENHPEVGIGALYQDRSGFGWHVAEMPTLRDGKQVNLPYGQVCIVPKWFGDKVGWWSLEGARTYGGDNALSARAYESGYAVQPIPRTFVHDASADVQDDLKRANHAEGLIEGQHPDTRAYMQIWPKGPVVRSERAFEPPHRKRLYRILYAPIFDSAFPAQKVQKYGLRDALQSVALVLECDYINGDNLLADAKMFKPDMILTQLHGADKVTPDVARAIRHACPDARWVNWNGDVWPGVLNDGDYISVLSHCDMVTVVNASIISDLRARGIKRVKYWQIGYEPEGVGYEPDDNTPRHDVVFLGNNYSPERRAFGDFLKSLHCDVGLYGGGWLPGESNGQNLYDFRSGCKIYRAAKVALSDSQWPHAARGFVSNRLFQAMAAGGALLLQQHFDGMEDLLGLEHGKHLIVWKDYDDLRDKITYYLEHEDERAKIARAGQHEILKKHSFHARLRELFDMLAAPEDHLIGPEYA